MADGPSTALTPVIAVPEKAHANGSSGAGQTEISQREKAKEEMAMATALHDFQGLSSKTSGGMDLMMSWSVTSSGSSARLAQGKQHASDRTLNKAFEIVLE